MANLPLGFVRQLDICGSLSQDGKTDGFETFVHANNLLPIPRASSFHEVILRFEEMLRTGVLTPGEKLPSEPELARAFQVSRPTLREALKAMNLLGLLVSRTGDGTYVSNDHSGIFRNALYFSSFFSAVDSLGLIEARIAIEPFLAEQAARRATADNLKRMQDCLRRMEAGIGKMEPYLEAEVAFHDEIIRAARSPVLRAILESLRDLLLEGRRKITADQTGPDNLRLHARIFQAIQKRSPVLARRRMLEHLEDSRSRYEAFYRKARMGAAERANVLSGASRSLVASAGARKRGNAANRRKRQ
jgi:GntR family transcriptional repressor for pyruvate dehydrogenase complex